MSEMGRKRTLARRCFEREGGVAERLVEEEPVLDVAAMVA